MKCRWVRPWWIVLKGARELYLRILLSLGLG